jgi:hypothetical protein
MTRHGLKAKVLWRAVRGWFARFSRLIAETGNSDEDLVFRIRKSQPALRAGTFTPRQAVEQIEGGREL